MDPRWPLSDPPAWMFEIMHKGFELLKKHHEFRSAAVGFAGPFLLADILFRFWRHLSETSKLKRKVMTSFRKALQFVRRYRALITVPLAGLALLIIDPHFAGSLCRTIMDALLGTSLRSPIARVLSLIAIVSGGIMLKFAKSDSMRMWAGIVFGLGMAIGAANFLTIMPG